MHKRHERLGQQFFWSESEGPLPRRVEPLEAPVEPQQPEQTKRLSEEAVTLLPGLFLLRNVPQLAHIIQRFADRITDERDVCETPKNRLAIDF